MKVLTLSPDRDASSNANSPSMHIGSVTPEVDRRRVPRLILSGEQFRIKTNGKIFSLSDLSETGFGIRLLDAADGVLYTVGAQVKGELRSGEHRHPVEARVRHLAFGPDGGHIGLEFEKISPVLKSFLDKRLSPVRLGAALRPIPSPGDYSLWFQGPTGTDLMVDLHENNRLKRFALFSAGKTIFFEDDVIRTGNYDSLPKSEEMRGVVCWDTYEVQFDAAPDPQKVRIAKEMVMSSKMPQELLKQLHTLLNPN